MAGKLVEGPKAQDRKHDDSTTSHAPNLQPKRKIEVI